MSETIKGTIVGYGPGIIYVEDAKDGTIYSMSNSSVERQCSDGLTEFKLPCKRSFKPTTLRPASRR